MYFPYVANRNDNMMNWETGELDQEFCKSSKEPFLPPQITVFVESSDSAQMTDRLRKRVFVCKEIIETEERYVHDLEYACL